MTLGKSSALSGPWFPDVWRGALGLRGLDQLITYQGPFHCEHCMTLQSSSSSAGQSRHKHPHPSWIFQHSKDGEYFPSFSKHVHNFHFRKYCQFERGSCPLMITSACTAHVPGQPTRPVFDRTLSPTHTLIPSSQPCPAWERGFLFT